MKTFAIFFSIACFVSFVAELDAEPNAMAETASHGTDLSAVVRETAEHKDLVIRRGGVDLVVIQDQISGITPEVQAVTLQGNDLAAVVDYDHCLCYKRYIKFNGSWKLRASQYFNTMSTVRRRTLILVEMVGLNRVVLAYSGVHDIDRKKGLTAAGDMKVTFEFSIDGKILKNGSAYNYNTGSE